MQIGANTVVVWVERATLALPLATRCHGRGQAQQTATMMAVESPILNTAKM